MVGLGLTVLIIRRPKMLEDIALLDKLIGILILIFIILFTTRERK